MIFDAAADAAEPARSPARLCRSTRAGRATFAGALVRRGEAVAEVTATDWRTRFARTAELVRSAHVVSSQQKAVQS